MGRLRIRARRHQAVIGLVALGGLSTAACASLLGIDDRSLDPTLGDGSTSQDGTLGDDGASSSSSGGGDATGAGDATVGGDASGSEASATGDSGNADGGAADAPGVDAAADVASCVDPCPMLTGLNHPGFIVADSQNVYWSEWGDSWGTSNGSVKGCPVGGCGAGPTVYAQGLTNPYGVAVDATDVYFTTSSYSGVTGAIWKCAIAGCGGSPTQLAVADEPFGVAVDGTWVYWVDNYDGTVFKVAKTGGTTVTLYDGGPYNDAGDTLSELGRVVVDGPYLFFSDYSEDIIRMSVNGGAPVLLGNTVNGGSYGSYFGIATDTASVYAGGNGIAMKADKLVADSGTPLVTGITTPLGLTRDPASGLIYWANWGTGNANDGTIGKFSPDGGGKTVMKASLVTPEAIAVSGPFAFWVSDGVLTSPGTSYATNPSTGTLWRTAK